MYYRRVLPTLVLLAAIGVIWSAVLVGFLLADLPLLPMAVVAPVAAVLVLPCFLAVAANNVMARGRRRVGPRQDQRGMLRILPRWSRALSVVLFLAFLVSGITAVTGIGGSVQMRNGHYVLVERGKTTVVDKSVYDRHLAQQERATLSVLGAFGVAAAMFGSASAARGRAG